MNPSTTFIQHTFQHLLIKKTELASQGVIPWKTGSVLIDGTAVRLLVSFSLKARKRPGFYPPWR